jgi:hypothetical protein
MSRLSGVSSNNRSNRPLPVRNSRIAGCEMPPKRNRLPMKVKAFQDHVGIRAIILLHGLPSPATGPRARPRPHPAARPTAYRSEADPAPIAASSDSHPDSRTAPPPLRGPARSRPWHRCCGVEDHHPLRRPMSAPRHRGRLTASFFAASSTVTGNRLTGRAIKDQGLLATAIIDFANAGTRPTRRNWTSTKPASRNSSPKVPTDQNLICP